MTYKVIHNALGNKVQTQAICHMQLPYNRQYATVVQQPRRLFGPRLIFPMCLFSYQRPWAAFRKTPV